MQLLYAAPGAIEGLPDDEMSNIRAQIDYQAHGGTKPTARSTPATTNNAEAPSGSDPSAIDSLSFGKRAAIDSPSEATAPPSSTAAPTTGLKIVLDDLWVSADTAMRVEISEETSGTVVWAAYLPANGSVQFTPRDGLKLDTANKKARFKTSASGNVRVTALYHSG